MLSAIACRSALLAFRADFRMRQVKPLGQKVAEALGGSLLLTFGAPRLGPTFPAEPMPIITEGSAYAYCPQRWEKGERPSRVAGWLAYAKHHVRLHISSAYRLIKAYMYAKVKLYSIASSACTTKRVSFIPEKSLAISNTARRIKAPHCVLGRFALDRLSPMLW